MSSMGEEELLSCLGEELPSWYVRNLVLYLDSCVYAGLPDETSVESTPGVSVEGSLERDVTFTEEVTVWEPHHGMNSESVESTPNLVYGTNRGKTNWVLSFWVRVVQSAVHKAAVRRLVDVFLENEMELTKKVILPSAPGGASNVGVSLWYDLRGRMDWILSFWVRVVQGAVA